MYSLYHALGPATWAKAFPIANGKKQSPIDITPGTATFDAKLAGGPLVTSYVKVFPVFFTCSDPAA
jgi:carbonic anhydrase